VVVSLVHISLGSSCLIAHVLHYPQYFLLPPELYPQEEEEEESTGGGSENERKESVSHA
jgi:hypothetical protein